MKVHELVAATDAAFPKMIMVFIYGDNPKQKRRTFNMLTALYRHDPSITPPTVPDTSYGCSVSQSGDKALTILGNILRAYPRLHPHPYVASTFSFLECSPDISEGYRFKWLAYLHERLGEGRTSGGKVKIKKEPKIPEDRR
jgi:hypothetical protein